MNRVYLDFNATTPLDSTVLDVITTTLKDFWANPGSSHKSGQAAATVVRKAREDVARMLDADADDIIFTSGGTESNNWVIHSCINHFQSNCKEVTLVDKTKSLPHIVTTNVEHDSIVKFLDKLLQEEKIDVTYVPVSPTTGSIDVDDIITSIRPTTCLVTVMMANNETGAIQPVDKICQRIKEMNKLRKHLTRILTHTDAAQAIGKIPVSVKDLGVDYLTIAGHKFYGPRTGALYARKPGTDTPVTPLLYGGGQERNFRPGTENVAMIAGLGKAADLVYNNLISYAEHMKEIRDYLKMEMMNIFGNKVHLNNDFPHILPNTCNVSFVGQGLEGYKILNSCQQLEASCGAACHSKKNIYSSVLLASGITEAHASNALRLSIGRDTTKNDIDAVIQDLQQALKSVMPSYVIQENKIKQS